MAKVSDRSTIDQTLERNAQLVRKLSQGARAVREAGAQAEPEVRPQPVTLTVGGTSPLRQD